MVVLQKNCLFNTQPPLCSVMNCGLQWLFILNTVRVCIICIFGIFEWKTLHTTGVSYNQSIIFMVCIKFVLIWSGTLWGFSLPMLYLVFWF